MTAETLHDALTLLPEDLLTDVDSLRKRKPIPWKAIGAAAACLCLAVGLTFLFPGGSKTADSAPMELPKDSSLEHSMSGKGDCHTCDKITVEYMDFIVISVAPEELTVCFPDDPTPITVLLKDLEDIPELSPGQTVRIYDKEFGYYTKPLNPYKLEIIDNTQGG